MKKRGAHTGDVTIPANLLCQGVNVLALEASGSVP